MVRLTFSSVEKVSLIKSSSLTNKLMVRVTNYFDTQVRVPIAEDASQNGPSSNRQGSDGAGFAGKSSFSTHVQGSTLSARKMSDEQIINWYGKILDSVRLRYRKLQRFARYEVPSTPGQHTSINRCPCEGSLLSASAILRSTASRKFLLTISSLF